MTENTPNTEETQTPDVPSDDRVMNTLPRYGSIAYTQANGNVVVARVGSVLSESTQKDKPRKMLVGIIRRHNEFGEDTYQLIYQYVADDLQKLSPALRERWSKLLGHVSIFEILPSRVIECERILVDAAGDLVTRLLTAFEYGLFLQPYLPDEEEDEDADSEDGEDDGDGEDNEDGEDDEGDDEDDDGDDDEDEGDEDEEDDEDGEGGDEEDDAGADDEHRSVSADPPFDEPRFEDGRVNDQDDQGDQGGDEP